jgi:hypothetical protein
MTSTSHVRTIVLGLVLAHVVLAALIWSDVIKFASTDAKLSVAITLSVLGVLLIVYALYLSTV